MRRLLMPTIGLIGLILVTIDVAWLLVMIVQRAMH